MKPVTAIKRFMEEHRGCYQNSHNIEFDRMDDSLMVSYTDYHNPEHKYVDFFLSYEKSIEQFIMDFAIKTPKDLDNVTIEQLWEAFWSGKGKIYCGLEFSLIYFTLYFKTEDKKLFAINENKERFEVTDKLESIADFSNYTHKQFENCANYSQTCAISPQSPL